MSRFPHMPDAAEASPSTPVDIINPPATVVSSPEPDCPHPADERERSWFTDATNWWWQQVCRRCGATVEITDGGPAPHSNGEGPVG